MSVLTRKTEEHVEGGGKAIAFDLDPESLHSLHEAFPQRQVEVVQGATATTLSQDRHLGVADLLILGLRHNSVETLSLCRSLRSQAEWARTPLLALVPPNQPELVGELLKAGANNCLVLPVYAKEMVHMAIHSQDGNRPGRHTLSLDRAQRIDPWRDDGGQG